MRFATIAFLTCVLALSSLAAAPSASPQASKESPPSRGWLLLEGGGALRGTEVAKRFVRLAGGPKAHIVLIPTAISESEYTPDRLARCEARGAAIFEVPHVTCLDVRDRSGANDPRFLAAVRRADGVWFFGGDEERLVDRFVGTSAVKAFRDVLDRGGVLGGTSAGAMILGGYIPARDSLRVSAFEFLPRVAIAPHYNERQYGPELRAGLAKRPGFRGIGIDESTAVVVHGCEMEVIGIGTVTVVDDHVTVLKPGDHFGL